MCKKCKHSKCSCIPTIEEISKTYTIPVPGAKGDKGDRYVVIYAKNTSSTIPPVITNVPNPSGWSIQPPQLSTGEYRWYITGMLNHDGTELVQNWTIPVSDTLTTYPYGAELDSEVFDI